MVSVVPVVMTACVKIFKKAREHLSAWRSKHASTSSLTHEDISESLVISFTTADVDVTKLARSADDNMDDFGVNEHHEMREI